MSKCNLTTSLIRLTEDVAITVETGKGRIFPNMETPDRPTYGETSYDYIRTLGGGGGGLFLTVVLQSYSV